MADLIKYGIVGAVVLVIIAILVWMFLYKKDDYPNIENYTDVTGKNLLVVDTSGNMQAFSVDTFVYPLISKLSDAQVTAVGNLITTATTNLPLSSSQSTSVGSLITTATNNLPLSTSQTSTVESKITTALSGRPTSSDLSTINTSITDLKNRVAALEGPIKLYYGNNTSDFFHVKDLTANPATPVVP